MAAALGLYEVLKVDADFFSAHISLCLYKRSFFKFCNCECEKKQAAFLLGSAVMGVLRPFTQEVP